MSDITLTFANHSNSIQEFGIIKVDEFLKVERKCWCISFVLEPKEKFVYTFLKEKYKMLNEYRQPILYCKPLDFFESTLHTINDEVLSEAFKVDLLVSENKTLIFDGTSFSFNEISKEKGMMQIIQ